MTCISDDSWYCVRKYKLFKANEKVCSGQISFKHRIWKLSENCYIFFWLGTWALVAWPLFPCDQHVDRWELLHSFMTEKTQNLWVFGSLLSYLWLSTYMICIFILVFTVPVEKNLCLSLTSVKKVLLELHVFKCDRWMIRRDWTFAATVVVVWVWITLHLKWIVDWPIFLFSYLWFQLGAIFLYLLVFLRMYFHSHWALCGEAKAIIFVPGTRQLLTLKGTHGIGRVRQWSNISKEIDSLLKEIQSEIHVTLSPEEAKKSADLLLEKWDRLEGLHGRYLAVIN